MRFRLFSSLLALGLLAVSGWAIPAPDPTSAPVPGPAQAPGPTPAQAPAAPAAAQAVPVVGTFDRSSIVLAFYRSPLWEAAELRAPR